MAVNMYRRVDGIRVPSAGSPTRANFEMLEPCEVKISSTVLRGERGREASDLPDCKKYQISEVHHGAIRLSEQR